ncbi:Hypothetical protein A7982_02022 [Minicystis rosea]|nr:Hypothetical protein A7982_02022 [Minicystis rosea]
MLSQLLGKLFANNPLTFFPSVGLAIFMTVFVVVTVSVLRRRADTYREIESLPLASEEVRHER